MGFFIPRAHLRKEKDFTEWIIIGASKVVIEPTYPLSSRKVDVLQALSIWGNSKFTFKEIAEMVGVKPHIVSRWVNKVRKLNPHLKLERRLKRHVLRMTRWKGFERGLWLRKKEPL